MRTGPTKTEKVGEDPPPMRCCAYKVDPRFGKRSRGLGNLCFKPAKTLGLGERHPPRPLCGIHKPCRGPGSYLDVELEPRHVPKEWRERYVIGLEMQVNYHRHEQQLHRIAEADLRRSIAEFEKEKT